MTAEQHQLVKVLSPALQIGLGQRLALGRHQQHPAPRSERNRLEGSEHRLRLEHHARTTAVGLIVNLAVAIGGVIARVVQMQLCPPSSEGSADHPKFSKWRKRLRRQADHVQAIGRHGSGLRR